MALSGPVAGAAQASGAANVQASTSAIDQARLTLGTEFLAVRSDDARAVIAIPVWTAMEVQNEKVPAVRRPGGRARIGRAGSSGRTRRRRQDRNALLPRKQRLGLCFRLRS